MVRVTLRGAFLCLLTNSVCLSWCLAALQPAGLHMHGLKHTSWSLTHLFTNGDDEDDPLPIASTEQSVISALRFQEDERLVATFLPCTDHLEMIYQQQTNLGTTNSSKSLLQITDYASRCPECTKPQDQAEMCYIGNSSNSLAVAFVHALLNTSSYQVTDDGSTLQLFNQKGNVLMELLSCRMESKLAGTSWHTSAIWTEDPPIYPTEVVDPKSVTAHFEHCLIRGRSACNGYSGNYRTSAAGDDNHQFILHSLSSTLVYCPEPYSTIEMAFHKAMRQVAFYDFDDEEAKNLVLSDSLGNEVISFSRCEQVGLFHSPWASHANIRNRGWNTGGKEVTMEFGKDNMVRGKTLCGRDYEIAYTLDLDNSSMTFQVENWPEVQCDRADFEEGFQHDSYQIR